MSQRTIATAVCQNPLCGKTFHPYFGAARRYCSLPCGYLHRSMEKDGPDLAISSTLVGLIKELAPKVVLSTPVDGPCMITADYHAPNIDLLNLRRMLWCAKTLGIKKLCIIGDFLDMRFYMGHKKITKNDTAVLASFMAGQALLEELLKWFTSIVLVPGNHDYWLIQHHDGHASFPEWCAAVFENATKSGKLSVSAYPYIFVQDRNRDTKQMEKFALVHQRTFAGTNMAGVARDLEATRPEFRDHHVIVTHGHLDETSMSRPGHKQAISLAGMTDIERTEYPTMFPTRHRNWNTGFGFVTYGWAWTVPSLMPDTAVRALVTNLRRK
jgi:hypothetical protein